MEVVILAWSLRKLRNRYTCLSLTLFVNLIIGLRRVFIGTKDSRSGFPSRLAFLLPPRSTIEIQRASKKVAMTTTMGVHLHPRPPSHALPLAAPACSRVNLLMRQRPFPGLKVQMGPARLRFVSRCAADEPSPEEVEPQSSLYDVFREAIDKQDKEYIAALRATGACTDQEAMVMELESTLFRDEEDKLRTYVRGIDSNTCLLCREGRALAMMICIRVGMALDLSAEITANAHLRVNASSEISPHTVEQIIRTYVSTILKTSEDACHRKVDRATIISFLDALRGLAAMSHILFEDTLVSVNSSIEVSSSKYSPEQDVEALNHELKRDLTELEKNFAKASEKEAYELLRPTVDSATDQAACFVYKMLLLR